MTQHRTLIFLEKPGAPEKNKACYFPMTASKLLDFKNLS